MQQQALSLTTKSLEKGEHNGKEADKKVRGVFYGSDLCRGGRTGDCATYYAGRTEGTETGYTSFAKRPQDDHIAVTGGIVRVQYGRDQKENRKYPLGSFLCGRGGIRASSVISQGRPEGLAGAQRRPYRHENAEICLKHSETNRRSSRYSLCFRRRNCRYEWT